MRANLPQSRLVNPISINSRSSLVYRYYLPAFIALGVCLGSLEPGLAQAPSAAKAPIDLKSRALDRIPVRNVIGQTPPKGWSNLVLFATPTLTAEDLKESPALAADYARMFKFVILANVTGQKDAYRLEKVARGFATNIKGKETIVDSKHTLGASMGLFGARILAENEDCIEKELRQVVRTPTMMIFDGNAVMRQNDEHVKMVIRHVVVVDRATGQLYTLVWLLTKDYQLAEPTIQVLPNGCREARYLSVKRDQFTLGIPTKEAFALRRIPQGKAVHYDAELKWAASFKTFSEEAVPKIESILLNIGKMAAVK